MLCCSIRKQTFIVWGKQQRLAHTLKLINTLIICCLLHMYIEMFKIANIKYEAYFPNYHFRTTVKFNKFEVLRTRDFFSNHQLFEVGIKVYTPKNDSLSVFFLSIMFCVCFFNAHKIYGLYTSRLISSASSTR